MTGHDALHLPARAKVNLVLRVVGRRADGYHLLETLFQTLDLHDDVVVSRRPEPGVGIDVTADRDELMVKADAQNLAARALTMLHEAARTDAGLHVSVHKRIPNGGGLGGGSSDAAAALRLGNRLLGDPLSDVELAKLAVRLGADVPFFLRGGAAWGRGIGDELEVADAAQRAFVLLVPPYGCNTADVYKMCATLWQKRVTADSVSGVTVPENRGDAVQTGTENDLQQAAEQLRPELRRLRELVADRGFPGVRMSGSGSTLFVPFEGPDRAARLAAANRARASLEPALGEGEHRGTRLVVTTSGPPTDADQPTPLARRAPD